MRYLESPAYKQVVDSPHSTFTPPGYFAPRFYSETIDTKYHYAEEHKLVYDEGEGSMHAFSFSRLNRYDVGKGK